MSQRHQVVQFARRRMNKQAHRPLRRRLPFRWIQTATLIAGLGVAAWCSGAWTSYLPALATALQPECTIKGNVSINTGERIYHVPGQRRYAETRISPQYGERWFCSEDDARAAGWRKARS
jgi:hypothetical protein